jgi:hypothetical protein
MDDNALDAAAAPNCPRDLVAMVLEGDGARTRWRCPECGLVSVGH